MFCCGIDMAQAIIGAVSRKLCNIIFAIFSENRPYEAVPPKGRF